MNKSFIFGVGVGALSMFAVGVSTQSVAFSLNLSDLDKIKDAASFVTDTVSKVVSNDGSKVDLDGSDPSLSLEKADQVTGLVRVDFDAYSVLINCADRAATVAWTDFTVDRSNEPRKHGFYYTEQLPRSCQPLSVDTYKGTYDGFKFQRGHLLNANAFDVNETLMKQANYMINVVPQVDTVNMRGSWREIEKRLECLRTPEYISNDSSLRVIAGPVWGVSSKDDYFMGSHGTATPSALYKIAILKSNNETKVYSWIFQNTKRESEKPNKLIDSYLTTPQAISEAIGVRQVLDLVPQEYWNVRATESPRLVRNCDYS